MKATLKTITTSACALAVCLCFLGCEASQDTATMPASTQAAMGALCDCGWEKGSEMCCKDGQEKCACGKMKGSTGCCK